MKSISFFINSKNREAGSTDDSDFYYNFNYRCNKNGDHVLNIDSLCIPEVITALMITIIHFNLIILI